MTILRRGKGQTFYLKRRVPRRFFDVERRPYVWISLKTDSEREARQRAEEVWNETVMAWQAKLDGKTDDAEERFEAAKKLAQRRGFRFLPLESVVRLPITELLTRLEAIGDGRDGTMDDLEVDALLGAVKTPRIRMERALEIYFEVSADKIRNKSDDQVRRWRNPFKKAVRNWCAVTTDPPIDEITPDDVFGFRDWWLEKVVGEGLTADSANKDITHLSTIFEAVRKRKRMSAVNPFRGIKLEAGRKRHRLPFSTDFLRNTFLKPGAFDGLNIEARCIVLGMVNTGYRPSEGSCLTRDQIRLDTDIPHIRIEPVGRELKSQYSERIIPLAGVSLEAFRQCPDGFPRYATTAGLSGLVNKYLRNNGLVETPEHTLYGLRHSFEDRLLDADVDERIRRDLMGHTLNRQRYGKGASLEKLHEIIQTIAL